MLNTVQKVQALKQVPLFAQLTGKERLLIALITTEEELAPDSILCEEGETGDELYLIVEGKISVERKSEDESIEQLAVCGANSCVGESSLFVDQPRNATLRAIEKSRVLFLQKILLHELINDYPKIALGIISGLIQRQ